jgi:predicted MFS family arabinose efflux permease
MLASGQGGLYLYAVLWGLGLGSENLIHSIRAAYFGQRYFGIISGYFTWPQMLGRMSGAVIGGIALDLMRSYLGAFLLAASLFALAAAVALVVNPPVCRRVLSSN